MTTRQIVIMPGGFHPFHAGHYSLYDAARKAFPNAAVYVAATNSQEERPFPFSIKEKLAKVAGVENGHFVQVKSPFRPIEITDQFNPETDSLIFVRSAKDVNENPKPGGVKKDGQPAYLQPLKKGAPLAPFGKHAYMAYLPTVKFGPGITSASEIRKMWPTLNAKRKLALVMSLYPVTQKNVKLATNVSKLIDVGMGASAITESASLLSEALSGGHAPHPEDYVYLAGSKGAKEATLAAIKTIKNPKTVTIKWDGYPALIFGHGTDGQFIIADKHMFNRADGTGRKITNPKAFMQYDLDRGVDRGELSRIINDIWPGLERASSGTKGYYWGDLLFSRPLVADNGKYTFKANPNGITYSVDANSQIGELMTNKTAGIAIHQWIAADAPEQALMAGGKKKVAPTDYAVSLDGSLGGVKNNSNVAVLPSSMPYVPKLKTPTAEINAVRQAITAHGAALDEFLNTAPSASFREGLLGVYFNQKIRAGNIKNLINDLHKFIETRPMTPNMKEKILQHFKAHKAGVFGLIAIWSAMYQLKMNIWKQLDNEANSSPVQGRLDDGTPGQEGFVSNGFKYVNRMGFSRQNFAVKESIEQPKLIYQGNCTNDDVVERIFGDATAFAQTVEEHGDDFTLGNLVVKYDPESDIHEFYYTRSTIKESINDNGFHNWFGASKVVDANGQPLVVYHGTNQDFKVFDASMASTSTGDPNTVLGFFFTDQQHDAARYGDKMLQVYLSIKNPYEATMDELVSLEKEDYEAMRDDLIASGHDGIVAPFDDGEGNWYVAFNSAQIKNATADKLQLVKEFIEKIKPMLSEATPEQKSKLVELMQTARDKLAEANINQQLALYSPDNATYRGHPLPDLANKKDIFNRRAQIDIDSLEDEPAPEPKMDHTIKALISSNLDKLSATERKILQLRYWQDLTLAEVASIMEITTERVRQIEQRAFRSFKLLSKFQPKALQQYTSQMLDEATTLVEFVPPSSGDDKFDRDFEFNQQLASLMEKADRIVLDVIKQAKGRKYPSQITEAVRAQLDPLVTPALKAWAATNYPDSFTDDEGDMPVTLGLTLHAYNKYREQFGATGIKIRQHKSGIRPLKQK